MLNIPHIDQARALQVAFWMETAFGELGQKERPGSIDNPQIMEYLKTVMRGVLHDEIPWCSAFVNWVLSENGLFGTGSALARSFFSWDADRCFELAKPRYGCIVILRRGNQAWQGHVGFYLCSDRNTPDGRFMLLGGNQGNGVSVKDYRFADVLGYRWPLFTVGTEKVTGKQRGLENAKAG